MNFQQLIENYNESVSNSYKLYLWDKIKNYEDIKNIRDYFKITKKDKNVIKRFIRIKYKIDFENIKH
jgi:hypothetical protein